MSFIFLPAPFPKSLHSTVPTLLPATVTFSFNFFCFISCSTASPEQNTAETREHKRSFQSHSVHRSSKRNASAIYCNQIMRRMSNHGLSKKTSPIVTRASLPPSKAGSQQEKGTLGTVSQGQRDGSAEAEGPPTPHL